MRIGPLLGLEQVEIVGQATRGACLQVERKAETQEQPRSNSRIPLRSRSHEESSTAFRVPSQQLERVFAEHDVRDRWDVAIEGELGCQCRTVAGGEQPWPWLHLKHGIEHL